MEWAISDLGVTFIPYSI